jgi:glycerol-3-phosphate acyltransferase PlsY
MISDAFSLNPVLYLFIPFAFLLGSVPFGIIFTRKKGVDIRSVGSKNIGATNVLRAAGKKSALLTLLGDVAKGLVPVLICSIVVRRMDISGPPGFADLARDLWMGITGISAVLGHMLSVFLSFRGGKGVATGFGVLLIYSPSVAGVILLIWLVTAAVFRYSALAALVAVGALPFLFVVTKSSSVKVAAGTIIAALIIYRHKSNIRNLLSGTEDKIGEKHGEK